MHPKIFGPNTFTYFLALAAVVGTTVHLVLVRRAQLPVRRILLLNATVCLAMLIGARVFSMLLDPDPWSSRLLTGRFRYPGALIGLGLSLPLLNWMSRGIPLRHWFDLLVPGAAFSLAIIRVDCLLAGCCAGGVSHLPWAIHFPAGSKPWYAQVTEGLISITAASTLPVHPLQLYFLFTAVGVGALALWWLPRRAYDGQVALLFLAVHELAKFGLEFLREPRILQLQLVSLAIGVAASIALLAIHLRARRTLRLGRLEAA